MYLLLFWLKLLSNIEFYLNIPIFQLIQEYCLFVELVLNVFIPYKNILNVNSKNLTNSKIMTHDFGFQT